MSIAFSSHTRMTFPCELTTMECGLCGGVYAIAETYRKKKHEMGQGWHCPYCKCSWGYFGNGKVEILEKNLAAERARHDQTKADLRETELRRRAECGAKTKIKKHIAAGVCPCCRRTFQQVARHIQDKHPDYFKENQNEFPNR